MKSFHQNPSLTAAFVAITGLRAIVGPHGALRNQLTAVVQSGLSEVSSSHYRPNASCKL
jgi:hypothetical protein